MNFFSSEFNTLHYIIKRANNILLFAHSGPDSDTIGSVASLKEYLDDIKKKSTVACFDPLPEYLRDFISFPIQHPYTLDLKSFDVIIACDSVERGFDIVKPKLTEDQVVVLLDHHPDSKMEGDVNIIDSSYAAVCEMIYSYFEYCAIPITKRIATFLMLGIMGDTGSFQHANTTARVIEIASRLMKKGAPLSKIVNLALSNKKLTTLKLWGKAFEKAKINPQSGMIATVLTKKDIEECNASVEDVSQVASILNTVPLTKFALVLYERDKNTIKGSLRSEEYKGIDVSQIAHQFGGGGHRLASGFEIRGKIKETEKGWEVI